FAPSEQPSAERSRPRVVLPSVHDVVQPSPTASPFDARQAHRTQAGLGPLVPAELLSDPPHGARAPAAASPPEPSTKAPPASAPVAPNSTVAPMESRAAEVKPFVPATEAQRTLADSPDARAAAAAAQAEAGPNESRA